MAHKRTKSHLRLVNSLLRSANKSKPVLVTEDVEVELMYQHYEARIKKIEGMLDVTSPEDNSHNYSLELGYLLYPLIDGISNDMYKMSSRKYLIKILKYSKKEADFLISMFRNGILHGGTARRLIYEDGEVTPITFSGGGSGGPIPHTEGDKGIEYLELPNGEHQLWVILDRLLAHVKEELRVKRSSETRTYIHRTVAEKKTGNRPNAAIWRTR
jgi:hypothetical protein